MKNHRLGIILCIVGLILVGSGLIIQFLGGSKNEDVKPPKNEPTEAEIAESILKKFGIDNYLSVILKPDVELDTNILDTTSKRYMLSYFYSLADIDKYDFHFAGTDYIQSSVKFKDYDDRFIKVFGVRSNFEVRDIAMDIPELVKNDDGSYEVSFDGAEVCNKEDVSNCYVLLLRKISNKLTASFSNLVMKDKTITGNVRVSDVSLEGDKLYLDAEFKFVYEGEDEVTTINSLVITSVNDTYNS